VFDGGGRQELLGIEAGEEVTRVRLVEIGHLAL
jgi:hypothetical protein